MKSIIALGMTVFLSAEILAQDGFVLPAGDADTAQALVETALDSDLACDIVESLTTSVGPRLAGSEAEARARVWGEELGRELGFDRVRVEEFTMPYWERGEMEIIMTAPSAGGTPSVAVPRPSGCARSARTAIACPIPA